MQRPPIRLTERPPRVDRSRALSDDQITHLLRTTGSTNPTVSDIPLQEILRHYPEAASIFIDSHIVNDNCPGEQQAKYSALRKFNTFCSALNIPPQFGLPDLNAAGLKPYTTLLREDDLLCSFALYLALYGYALSTVQGYISKLRVVYLANYGVSYGSPLTHGKTKVSRFLLSLQTFWPPKASPKDGRLPFTPSQISVVYNHATTLRRWSIAATILTCWAGLFRLGELTRRGKRSTYDSRRHLAEADIQFVPDFITPTSVTFFMGPSKADPLARKAKLIQRTFPVTAHHQCAGRALHVMLRNRYNIPQGGQWIPSKRPLFQDDKGNQLTSRCIINFHQAALRVCLGMSRESTMLYTGHSYRIGAATHLFTKHNASPDTLKLLGGWSSEAYRSYLRSRQAEFNHIIADLATKPLAPSGCWAS